MLREYAQHDNSRLRITARGETAFYSIPQLRRHVVHSAIAVDLDFVHQRLAVVPWEMVSGVVEEDREVDRLHVLGVHLRHEDDVFLIYPDLDIRPRFISKIRDIDVIERVPDRRARDGFATA